MEQLVTSYSLQGSIEQLVWALDKPEGRTPLEALEGLARILQAGARLLADHAGACRVRPHRPAPFERSGAVFSCSHRPAPCRSLPMENSIKRGLVRLCGG